MTEDEEKLAILVLAAERAWMTLDAAHRAMPQCEHNIAWQDSITAAQDEHRRALAARDRHLRMVARLDSDDTAEGI